MPVSCWWRARIISRAKRIRLYSGDSSSSDARYLLLFSGQQTMQMILILHEDTHEVRPECSLSGRHRHLYFICHSAHCEVTKLTICDTNLLGSTCRADHITADVDISSHDGGEGLPIAKGAVGSLVVTMLHSLCVDASGGSRAICCAFLSPKIELSLTFTVAPVAVLYAPEQRIFAPSSHYQTSLMHLV